MTGPDDIIDLAEMPSLDFWSEGTGAFVALATVAGYHLGVNPNVALAMWASQVCATLSEHASWDSAYTKLADMLSERAHQ